MNKYGIREGKEVAAAAVILCAFGVAVTIVVWFIIDAAKAPSVAPTPHPILHLQEGRKIPTVPDGAYLTEEPR